MKNSRVVYTTEKGRVCPTCEQAINECRCQINNAVYQNDGYVRLSRETKGRKGKGVTIIAGIPGNEKQIKALAKQLKQKLSCGGTVKNGLIEIQGDVREKLKVELEKLGHQVKG